MQILELDDPAMSPAQLQSCVDALEPNLVWVGGGNTFYLRHWMRQSGFDRVVERTCTPEDGPAAIYVGASAGAICAGSSIEPAFWKGWDSPSVVPDVDWSSERATRGLGLGGAGVHFFPHFDAGSGHAELVETSRSRMQGNSGGTSEVVTLRDDQAFVWTQVRDDQAGRSFIFHGDGALGRLRNVKPLPFPTPRGGTT